MFAGGALVAHGHEDLLLVKLGVIVILLQSSESCSAVVLRAAAALLVSEVLASVGSEQAWGKAVRLTIAGRGLISIINSPTCSAFSQLRFILD